MEDLSVAVAKLQEQHAQSESSIALVRDELRDFQKEVRDGMEVLREENKAIYEVASSVKIMANEMTALSNKLDKTNNDMNSGFDNVNRHVGDLSKRVDTIESAPGKGALETIGKVKATIISTIVAFLVGGVLGVLIQFVGNAAT